MHTPRRGEIWGIFGSFFSSEIANQNLNQIIVIPKLPRNSNSVFHSFLSTKKQNTEIRILHSYSTSISSTKEIGTLVTRKVTNINNSYIYLNLNIVKLWEHVYLLYYSLILMVTTLLQLGSFFLFDKNLYCRYTLKCMKCVIYQYQKNVHITNQTIEEWFYRAAASKCWRHRELESSTHATFLIRARPNLSFVIPDHLL